MTTRAKIATLSITALILCGIFSFVAFYKMDPVLLAEFSQELHNKNIIEGYEKKAHAGDPQAMLNLALAYEKGKLVPKNDELVTSWRKKAVEALEKKADQGDLEAIFYLGLAYQEGKIVEKNAETAFEWYQKGAEAGHAPSQNNLGVAYISGKGTEKDIEKAVYWYGKAAAQGESYATNNLCILHFHGEHSPADMNKAFKFCLASAENKYPYAAYLVGWMYMEGEGTPQNKPEGIKWLTYAADKKISGALYALAVMYEEGNGVEKDPQKAFDLLSQAAELNEERSLFLIANYYAEGHVVEKDYFKAEELFRKAESLGSEHAKKYLLRQADLCKMRVPSDFEEGRLAKSCILSANSGYAQAELAMGYMYQFGKTLGKNMFQAAIWYRKAAEQGNLPAQVMLANAYLQGDVMEIDLSEAYAWSLLASEQEPKTSWDKLAKQQNERSVLSTIEKTITPEQKEQALKRAEEYRKKYETQKTPP